MTSVLLDAERAARIRVVATDLDGTLLRDDQSVSARTRDAINDAQAAGITVVFATGRPPRWLPPVIDQTGHTAEAIVANGAAVLDPVAARLVDHRPIATDTVHAVGARLRARMPGIAFAVEQVPAAGVWEHAGAFAHEPAYSPRWQPPHPVTVGALEIILEQPGPLKLIGRLPNAGITAEQLRDLAHAEVGEDVEVTLSDPRLHMVEMGAAGVSKGSALAGLAHRHGWRADEVAAVGDMVNDIPMLTWVGNPFIVGNAHTRLRGLSAGVLPSNEADGVAVLLETLVAHRG